MEQTLRNIKMAVTGLAGAITAELGSMAENAVAMGAPCPAFLQKALEVAQAGLEAAGDSWPEMGNSQSGENGGNEGKDENGGEKG